MLVLMTHGVSEHIQHTMRQVAATRCTGRSLLEYRSGNWLQQHVGATCRSDKYYCFLIIVITLFI